MTTPTSINRFVTREKGKQEREEARMHALRKCMLLFEKEDPRHSFRLIWVCSGTDFLNTPELILFYTPGEQVYSRKAKEYILCDKIRRQL